MREAVAKGDRRGAQGGTRLHTVAYTLWRFQTEFSLGMSRVQAIVLTYRVVECLSLYKPHRKHCFKK